jgi:uncharacterized membrane protein YgdD (TMEM256/DUF423 family)
MWRERFEEEFQELLRARPPSLPDVLDIVRGALDAHLHFARQGTSTEDAPALVHRVAVVFLVFLVIFGIAWFAGDGVTEFFSRVAWRSALPLVAAATGLVFTTGYMVLTVAVLRMLQEIRGRLELSEGSDSPNLLLLRGEL